MEVRIENEMLREEYMLAVRQLKLLYSKGPLVLNPRTLERVKASIKPEIVLKAAGININ